jgi:FkbM family methyltransferase
LSIVGRFLFRLAARLPAPIQRFLAELRHSSPITRRLLNLLGQRMRESDVVVEKGLARGLRIECRGGKISYGLGTSEPETQETLARIVKRGDVFYDIGANVGFFTLIGARLVGGEGIVYAFEPVPAHAETLRRNVELNALKNVVVLEKAAGSSSGPGQLTLEDDPTGAHLASEDASGDVVVEVVAIDDLVESRMIPPPKVVKLDVEGAELAVIDGMRRTIERSRPIIVCELHGTDSEFNDFMSRLGYSVELIEEAVHHDNPRALALPE